MMAEKCVANVTHSGDTTCGSRAHLLTDTIRTENSATMSTMMFPSSDRETLFASIAIIHILLMLPPDLLLLLADFFKLNLKTLTQPHKVILDSHTVIQVHLEADNFLSESGDLHS